MSARRDNWLPTRRSLITRLKRWDDQESWRDFFETYSKLLYSMAARSGFDDAEAQDIVQETIITVARHIPNFRYDSARGSFKAWLLGIARSRIIDHIRKRQRQPPRPPPSSTTRTARTSTIDKVPEPKGPELERVWDEEWRRFLYEAALAKVKEKVSEKEFQIYDCYVLKDWTVQEVSTVLRVSEASVYTAKSRVTGLLQRTIKDLETKIA